MSPSPFLVDILFPQEPPIMNNATNAARDFDADHDAAAARATAACRAHGPASAEYADAMAAIASIDRAASYAGWANLSARA